MQIAVTHEDGSTTDVTALVRNAYEMLWEGTRFDRDWSASDVERLAELARVIGHPSAEAAAEIAVDVRRGEYEQEAYYGAARRERAMATVEALNAFG